MTPARTPLDGDLRDDKIVRALGFTFPEGAVPLEIAQVTGLAVATVTERLRVLARDGRVVDVGAVRAGQGRPFRLWCLPWVAGDPGAVERGLAQASSRARGRRSAPKRTPRLRVVPPAPMRPVHVPRRRSAAVVVDPLARRVLGALRRAAAPLSLAELCLAVGAPAKTLSPALLLLLDTGEAFAVTRARVLRLTPSVLRESQRCYTADPRPVVVPPLF